MMNEDGSIFLRGRKSDMLRFKVNAEVVYPSAIENVMSQHPAIKQIVVRVNTLFLRCIVIYPYCDTFCSRRNHISYTYMYMYLGSGRTAQLHCFLSIFDSKNCFGICGFELVIRSNSMNKAADTHTYLISFPQIFETCLCTSFLFLGRAILSIT